MTAGKERVTTGRFGRKILETPFGTWWWSSVLQCIDYIPVGFSNSYYQVSLNKRENTLPGAINKACREELKDITLSIERRYRGFEER
jgi:hypothetical protein